MLCIVRLRSVLNRIQRSYGTERKSNNYYEVLGIPQDATKKDIRIAFIKLSKEVHPDTSSKSEKSSHDEFVKINEAYNTLSKDHSRQQYDLDLKYGYNPNKSTFRRSHEMVYDYRDPMWHATRGRGPRGKFHEEYYRNMQPRHTHHNIIVIMFIFIFFIGGAIQVAAISLGTSRYREREKRNLERYNWEYDYRRLQAQLHIADRMIDEIEDKLISDNLRSDETER